MSTYIVQGCSRDSVFVHQKAWKCWLSRQGRALDDGEVLEKREGQRGVVMVEGEKPLWCNNNREVHPYK